MKVCFTLHLHLHCPEMPGIQGVSIGSIAPFHGSGFGALIKALVAFIALIKRVRERAAGLFVLMIFTTEKMYSRNVENFYLN